MAKKKRVEHEYQIQKALAEWMIEEYPGVIFRSDLGGIFMPIGLALKAKRIQSPDHYPDFFVARCHAGWAGLYLELKKERAEYLKVDGTLRQNKHIIKQIDCLTKLAAAGYCSMFAGGLEEAKEIISWYLAQSPTVTLERGRMIIWPT